MYYYYKHYLVPLETKYQTMRQPQLDKRKSRQRRLGLHKLIQQQYDQPKPCSYRITLRQ